MRTLTNLFFVACFVLLGIGGVSACSKVTNETERFPLPRELQDCTIHAVSSHLTTLHIVRCPKERCTTTTSSDGKIRRNVTVCEVE